MNVNLHGERLTLLPERALYWERTRTLFLADAHLGKAATFRAFGMPLPEGGTEADLSRLSAAVERTGAESLIVLGDLLHAEKGRDTATLESVSAWRRRCSFLDVLLVRGNHDDRAGDPPEDWQVRCVDGPVLLPPFVLNHVPLADPRGYVLAGHLHPAVRLVGRGRQTVKLPCFWFGEPGAVLPAFGSFIAGATIRPRSGDRVFVATEAEVLAV